MAELIPKSNPFLRKLIGYIAGPDIDDRIKWIVENLSKIFLARNVAAILNNYGKENIIADSVKQWLLYKSKIKKNSTLKKTFIEE